MKRKCRNINAKQFAEKCCIFSPFPLFLYINRNPTLPSLCEASHKDGYGEHFEQQPIDTEDGDLYVSFWNSGDNYSIMIRDELDEYIDNQGMTMGASDRKQRSEKGRGQIHDPAERLLHNMACRIVQD